MAKDIYHEIVKAALIKDGWTITHDPMTIPGVGQKPFYIDLAAEKLIAAEKEGEKIAVEVKSFIGRSFADDFHDALGKYINYMVALPNKDPDRLLFMAVPDLVFEDYFESTHVQKVMELYKLRILIFNVDNQIIVQWIN